MSENDWWQDLYGPEQGDDRGAESGTPVVKKPDDTDTERRALATVSPATAVRNAPYTPPSADSWGGAHRELDPFLKENPAHTPDLGGVTPEEAAELKKHEEKLEEAPAAPVEPPKESEPKPEPEAVPEPEKTPEPDADEDQKKGFKERIQDTRAKVSKAKAVVSEKTEPVRKVSGAAFHAVTPEKGAHFSFLWSLGGAWILSPQFIVALADRVALIFGSPRPLSGEERMDWGWLHGIGPWFADQIKLHMDAGTIGRLVLLCLVGLGPVLIAQFAEKIPRERFRKFLRFLGYGFPTFWILGKWYFDHWGANSLGFKTWNDMYVSAFAALAWWGFSFSRTIQPGFAQCLLRIPLAAVIVGIGLNAPGAAF